MHLRSFDGGRFNLIQLRCSTRIATQVLALSDFLYLTTSNKVSQTYTAKEFVDLLTEVTPQMVGQTGVTGVAVTQTLTTCRINRFVNRIDHLRYLNALHVAGQLVTTTWATHARHQITATQFGEKLFKVGQGYALPL